MAIYISDYYVLNIHKGGEVRAQTQATVLGQMAKKSEIKDRKIYSYAAATILFVLNSPKKTRFKIELDHQLYDRFLKKGQVGPIEHAAILNTAIQVANYALRVGYKS